MRVANPALIRRLAWRTSGRGQQRSASELTLSRFYGCERSARILSKPNEEASALPKTSAGFKVLFLATESSIVDV